MEPPPQFSNAGLRVNNAQRNIQPDFPSAPPHGPNGQMHANFTPGPLPVPAGLPGPNGHGFANQTPRRNGNALHGGPHGGFGFREIAGGTKNTSHVPCKFFRLGNCQAGKACPFSHALDTINDPAPCKYFAKGNCKYGYKCANPHVLPDGRDGRKVNHGRRPFSQDGGGFNIGPPAHTGPYQEQGMMNTFPVMPPSASNFGEPSSEELYLQQRIRDHLPTIDQAYNAHLPMQYGSPPHENRNPLSPPIRAMDAQLPASFDGNGISNLARQGPMASSVPSRFGFGPSSPTTSTENSIAFGNLGYMARGDMNGSYSGRAADLGSSPQAAPEHAFAKRILHSDRTSQLHHVASSLPVPRPMMRMHRNVGDSEDDSDDDKVNWLPGALSDDVMTPQEKMRRFSRNVDDDNGLSARGSLTLSGLGSAQDSKVGSPANGSPSSRWGAFFAQKQRQVDATSDVHSSSPYGHVGSPLRNSSLPFNPNASPSIRPIARPQTGSRSGDVSPFVMSSPTSGIRTTAGSGIGILSQQLKNTRLRDSTSVNTSTEWSSTQTLQPGGIRGISHTNSAASANALSATSNISTVGTSRLDRAVSTSSQGRSDRIDEEPAPEPEPYLFEMDEEDTRVRGLLKKEKEKQKRLSGGTGVYHGGSPWNAAPISEPRVSMSSSDGMSSSSPPGNVVAVVSGAATSGAGSTAGTSASASVPVGSQKPIGDQRR